MFRQNPNNMSSTGQHKTDSSSLSRLGCALATQLQLTAAKTSGTLASLTHRLSRHSNGKQFITENKISFQTSEKCFASKIKSFRLLMSVIVMFYKSFRYLSEKFFLFFSIFLNKFLDVFVFFLFKIECIEFILKFKQK